MVKAFLSQESVLFVGRDIATDEGAIRDLAELGYLTTPVTLVDGEVVVGFNKRRLEQLLG